MSFSEHSLKVFFGSLYVPSLFRLPSLMVIWSNRSNVSETSPPPPDEDVLGDRTAAAATNLSFVLILP